MSLMGLDIGTTGCKAVVFSEEGDLLASSYRDYPMYFPGEGQCELNPVEVWQGVREVVTAGAGEVKKKDPVKALGISTLGDSVTLLGRDGKPLHNTVVGAADRRAVHQARQLETKYGREKLFDLTGAPLHAFCVIPKILWFKDNRPELFEKAWKFSGLQEMVHYNLGLEPRMDLALAGRTMLVDIRKNTYAGNVMTENGISPDQFFPLSRGDHVAGELTEAAAAPLNLSKGTVVVTGGFDQSCCALGAGVIESGKTALSVGTLEAITPVFDSLRLDKALLTGNHGCIPGLVPELFTSLGYVTTSGGIVKWYHDHISADKEDGYSRMFAAMPEDPSKVFVLPYFAGTGTPWLDVNQYGSIFGLDLDTPKEVILKSILEGICYEVRLNIRSFTQAGIPVSSLRAVGGGSRSGEWMQIKADITGIPVETTSIPEAGCRGAAFLAGLGNGTYRSLKAIKDLTQVEKVFEPDTRKRGIYTEQFETYNSLRKRVEGLRLRTS